MKESEIRNIRDIRREGTKNEAAERVVERQREPDNESAERCIYNPGLLWHARRGDPRFPLRSAVHFANALAQELATCAAALGPQGHFNGEMAAGAALYW